MAVSSLIGSFETRLARAGGGRRPKKIERDMKQRQKSDCLSRTFPCAVPLLCISLLLLSVQCRGASQQSGAASNRNHVTFNRDIAPILFKYCAVCHSPGESGPFSLLTYEDARRHARQMVAPCRAD